MGVGAHQLQVEGTIGQGFKPVLGPGIVGPPLPKSGFCLILHTPSQFTLLGPLNLSLPRSEQTPLGSMVGVVLPGQPGVDPARRHSQDHSEGVGGIWVTLGQTGSAT